MNDIINKLKKEQNEQVKLTQLLVAFNKYEKLMEDVRECESYEFALSEMYSETNEKYAEAIGTLERACKALKDAQSN